MTEIKPTNMKKNLILALLLSACSFVGVNQAQAQIAVNIDVPPMTEKVQVMADQIIATQLNDPDAANKSFAKLLRSIRNDKEQLLAVGKFFLDKQIYPCANQCVKQLYTVDPTYVPGLMLAGHVAILRKDWGGAGQKFDEVLAHQPDNIEALRLNARVYKYVNPIVATETLNKILQLEPNNVDAYKQLGDIAYQGEEYKEAMNAYKTYFEKTPTLTTEHIRTGENYLLSLMNQQDFYTIKDMVEKLLPLDPKDLVFRRMQFFSQVATMDYQNAQESVKYITEKQYDDSLYLALDYLNAATFYDEGLDNKAEAIEYVKKALALDDKKADSYKRIATLYRQNKQAAEGIPYFEKYIELLGEKADAAERFPLGILYMAAKDQTEDAAQKQQYIEAGDKVFAKYMEEQPTKYQGPFYRAQLWVTDSNNPEEKPFEYYKQALTLLADGENVSQKKTALRYLIFYTLKKDQNADCLNYINQMLAIDPNDAFANKVKPLVS